MLEKCIASIQNNWDLHRSGVLSLPHVGSVYSFSWRLVAYLIVFGIHKPFLLLDEIWLYDVKYNKRGTPHWCICFWSVLQVLGAAINVYANKHKERPDRLIDMLTSSHRWYLILSCIWTRIVKNHTPAMWDMLCHQFVDSCMWLFVYKE